MENEETKVEGGQEVLETTETVETPVEETVAPLEEK